MGCENRTVRCHSITENKHLCQLVGDDTQKKVYRPITTFSDKVQTDVFGQPISMASTFFGFCSTHDNKLFKIVENANTIEGNEAQVYALTCRTIAYRICKCETLQRAFKNAIRMEPKLYLNKPLHSHDLGRQVCCVFDVRHNMALLRALNESFSEIMRNYSKDECWQIENRCLYFKTKIMKTNEPYFAFASNFVLMPKECTIPVGELPDQEYYKGNAVNLLVLPSKQSKEYQVILSANTKKAELIDFIDELFSLQKESFEKQLTALMLANSEELFISKEHWETLEQKKREAILNEVKKKSNCFSDPLIYDTIRQWASVNLFV